jgi:hypothetical protein
VNGPRGPCGPPAACGSSAPRHPCGGPFGSVSRGAIYPVKLPVSGSTRPNSAGRSPRRRRSRSARMVVSLSGEHGARKPFPRPEQPKGLVGPAGSGDAAPGWQAWRARRVRMADPRRGFLACAVSADRDALRRASLLIRPLGADDRRTVSRASRPRLRAGPIRMWSGPLFVKRSLAPRALRSFLPHISGFQHQSLFEQVILRTVDQTHLSSGHCRDRCQERPAIDQRRTSAAAVHPCDRARPADATGAAANSGHVTNAPPFVGPTLLSVGPTPRAGVSASRAPHKGPAAVVEVMGRKIFTGAWEY